MGAYYREKLADLFYTSTTINTIIAVPMVNFERELRFQPNKALTNLILVTNKANDFYRHLLSDQLDQCFQLPDMLACPFRHIEMYYKCINESCKTDHTEYIVQLKDELFEYSFNNGTDITLICDKTQTDISLGKLGVITIPNNCSVHGNTLKIFTHYKPSQIDKLVHKNISYPFLSLKTDLDDIKAAITLTKAEQKSLEISQNESVVPDIITASMAPGEKSNRDNFLAAQKDEAKAESRLADDVTDILSFVFDPTSTYTTIGLIIGAILLLIFVSCWIKHKGLPKISVRRSRSSGSLDIEAYRRRRRRRSSTPTSADRNRRAARTRHRTHSRRRDST